MTDHGIDRNVVVHAVFGEERDDLVVVAFGPGITKFLNKCFVLRSVAHDVPS